MAESLGSSLVSLTSNAAQSRYIYTVGDACLIYVELSLNRYLQTLRLHSVPRD